MRAIGLRGLAQWGRAFQGLATLPPPPKAERARLRRLASLGSLALFTFLPPPLNRVRTPVASGR